MPRAKRVVSTHADITQRKQKALRESENSLREAQRIAHIGSWHWDAITDAIWWSDELYRIFERNPATPPSTYEKDQKNYTLESAARLTVVVQKALKTGEPYVIDLERASHTGPGRWVLARGEAIRNASGQITGLRGAVQDITARKHTEMARDQFLSLLLATLESTADGILVINLAGKIEAFNRTFAQMWRLPDQVLADRDDASALQCVLDQLSDPQKFLERVDYLYHHPGEVSFDLLEFKDGRIIERNSQPQLIDGQVVGRVWSFRDISANKRVEEDLRTSREQMRGLATHLQTVREEERTKLAREMHDVLAQDLTRLKIDLVWLERRLARPGPDTGKEGLAPRVAEMSQVADSAIQCVQRIATGLRPAVLDSLGLCAAVEWQANDFQAHSGIACQVSVPETEPAVSHDVATATFRILQESLTNVLRHAYATRVDVSLRQEASQLVLLVADNGCGIRLKALSNPMSIGLAGMRERALLLGGQLEIRSLLESGTTIEMRLPPSGNGNPPQGKP